MPSIWTWGVNSFFFNHWVKCCSYKWQFHKNEGIEKKYFDQELRNKVYSGYQIRTNRMWQSTNRKISCSSLDTHDPKMIDDSFESPEVWTIKNFRNCKVTRRLSMMFESGTLDGKGRMEDLVIKKIPDFFFFILHHNIGLFEYEVSTHYLCS